MNYLVLHHGEAWQAVAATSLIRGLKRRDPTCSIVWATSVECRPIFEYNNKLSEAHVGYGPFKGNFDVAINLTPSEESASAMKESQAVEKFGFILDNGRVSVTHQENQYILDVFSGKISTQNHILQLYYRVAGMKWRGEGYDLSYYPRNKVKKKKTGVAVSDPSLRLFVKENLKLDHSELWHIPMRSNIFKRIDEINRVKHIITDDLLCAHIGIATRKHVEFLDTNDLNMSIEFFSKGYHHRINNGSQQLPNSQTSQ